MARYRYKRQYSFTPELAYIVGLMAADGCLLNDGRHLEFTSKDLQLAELFRDLIRPEGNIGTKLRAAGSSQIYYRVQFGDVALYDFLLEVGLTPKKSLTIEKVSVPEQLFPDFLRGHFDGDGSIFGYQDIRWKSSFVHYTAFCSASPPFLDWLKRNISVLVHTAGGSILHNKNSTVRNLRYAKADSDKLFHFMYYAPNLPYLERKHRKYIDLMNITGYNNLVSSASGGTVDAAA